MFPIAAIEPVFLIITVSNFAQLVNVLFGMLYIVPRSATSSLEQPLNTEFPFAFESPFPKLGRTTVINVEIDAKAFASIRVISGNMFAVISSNFVLRNAYVAKSPARSGKLALSSVEFANAYCPTLVAFGADTPVIFDDSKAYCRMVVPVIDMFPE